MPLTIPCSFKVTTTEEFDTLISWLQEQDPSIRWGGNNAKLLDKPEFGTDKAIKETPYLQVERGPILFRSAGFYSEYPLLSLPSLKVKDFNYWKEEILNRRALIETDNEEVALKLLKLLWPLDSGSPSFGMDYYGQHPSPSRTDEWLYWRSAEVKPQVNNIILASELYNLFNTTETSSPSIQLYPLIT